MIRTPSDVANAFAAGRKHVQRFLKNAGATGDSQWQDWAYASGQPAYDARIGDALTFTPQIATKNDAIWFPGIAAGQTRHLVGLSVYVTAGGTGQLTVDGVMYDLLGVYPLIDGDNTDPQPMDNTEPLPRYVDGVGVRAVLVNHIAPGIVAGAPCVIDYTDASDTARQMTVYSSLAGVGKAAASLASAGTVGGSLYLPNDGPGIKSIDSVQFTSAPGGLWCIYLVRPIETFAWRGGFAAVTQTVFADKNVLAESSFYAPRIYDGAHLGFFYMPNGSTRSVALFGTASFVWG